MSKCYCGRTFRPPMCDQTHTLSTEEYIKLYKKRIKLKTKRNWVDSVVESIPEGYEWVAESLVSAMNNDAALTELQRHGVALVAAILANNGELAFEICMNSPLFGTSERELAKKCAAIMEMNKWEETDRLIRLHFPDIEILKNKTVLVFLTTGQLLCNKMNETKLQASEIENIRAICAAVSVMNKIIV